MAALYHVFLSFRGADIRKTFADHLYRELTAKGLRTFRDDDEIERGEVIASELEKAIRQSRSSIIVLSEDYASSRWCLNELQLILEQKRNNSKYIVIPVFYHVDPSDVRHQKGKFGEAFRKQKERFAEDEEKKMEKIESWKKSLKEAADLGGMVLENQANGQEAEFIKLIVEELAKKLDRSILNVDPHRVGIDPRVEDINRWLHKECADVGIAAISGMGGIGKTTIAKVVYNQNFRIFEASSFLTNIRQACEQHDGLIGLLKQLFSDILKGRELKINNVDVGINRIRDALGRKRLLLVLDDVDQSDQLEKILGNLEWFCAGSKIIVTTRHEGLLKAYESCQMFKVRKLNDDDALLLFSRHSFKKDHPTEGYMEHAKNFVQKCGGIPLAIQVLGTSLLGESLAYWESVIERMDYVFDSDILKVLRISYDSLKDDLDKRLFLDIACFFVGKDLNFAVQVLDECDLFPRAGIQNLVNRCLITVSEDNKLMIHQLLQDMAREIVRHESPEHPGSRTRVWHHKDAFEILKEKSGTERVSGLVLNLQLLKEAKDVDLVTTAFSRMHNLQLLHLDYVRLSGGYREFPKKLRWLSWHGFHLKCIPSDFDMENLVVLDMRNSYLVNVWNGAKPIKRLKILNLSHSHCLVNTPNFSGVPNLEELILKDCIKLEVIHDSIKELRKLVLLDLEGCKSFRNFGIFEQLKSLEKLNLSNCLNLEEYLPVELGEKESLTLLSADGTAINRLPSTSGHLRNVCNFIIAKVSRSFWPQTSLTMIPKPIQFSLASLPISLKRLNLADNRLTDDVMPVDMSSLSSLEYLNLERNLLTRLPESIKGLTMLKTLELTSCSRLESLPELPLCLRILSAKHCVSLERINYLPNRSSVLSLSMDGCKKLVEIENVYMLAPLVNFDMKMVCDLGLVGFESIEEGIQVEMHNKLTRTRKKGPVQGLYEFCILSTFYPCSKVPDWFSIKALGNGNGRNTDIRFTIPSLVNMKIRCLSFCTVYVGRNDIDQIIYDRIQVFVINLSKCVMWVYIPTFIGVGRRNEEMIWIGQSCFGNKFEGGDRVEVIFNQRLHPGLEIKEVGVHVYYEKEIEQHATNQSVIEGGGFQSYDDMLRAHALDSRGAFMINPLELNRLITRYPHVSGGRYESWEATHYLE